MSSILLVPDQSPDELHLYKINTLSHNPFIACLRPIHYESRILLSTPTAWLWREHRSPAGKPMVNRRHTDGLIRTRTTRRRTDGWISKSSLAIGESQSARNYGYHDIFHLSTNRVINSHREVCRSDQENVYKSRGIATRMESEHKENIVEKAREIN